MNVKLKLSSVKYSETILFGFIWLLFFLSPFFIPNENSAFYWDHLFKVWKRFSPFFVFSLINHFVLIPHLFYKRKIVYIASTLLLLILLNFTLKSLDINRVRYVQQINRQATEEQIRPPDRLPPHLVKPLTPPDRQPGLRQNLPIQRPEDLPPWINSIVIAILILGFDIGLRTTFKWTKMERERERADKERVKSELAFLRNQLSPHFFMNTLNNIHALVDINAEEAKESIIRLSKLMRHLLYDSDQERIPLIKEIEFIESYVDLMKLRFSEKVKIDFTFNFTESNILLPPLLFTSLIENAFKYGISYQNDSFIDIQLSSTENELSFSIRNSIAEAINTDENNSGIGLENTRKRLDLIYGNNYQLNITNVGDIFTVQLKLPL